LQLSAASGHRVAAFWNHSGFVQIPAYYGDHFDLKTGATNFDLSRLRLDHRGLKVLCFHPNIVYVNGVEEAAYLATKSFYHQPDRLLAARHKGEGIRTFLLRIIEYVGLGKFRRLLWGK
jgi:hypothetical protein